MVRNFRSLQEFLETRYPELRGSIQGGNYPPPAHAILAVQGAQIVQFGCLALMFGGGAIFSTLGLAPPEWYGWLTENKMSAFVGTFFLNSVANSMTATGAFEACSLVVVTVVVVWTA